MSSVTSAPGTKQTHHAAAKLRNRLRYAAGLLERLNTQERLEAVWIWTDPAGAVHCTGPADEYSLGRDNSNTITIADPRVSRKHALVRREHQYWVLVNLSSTGITAVNFQPTEGKRLNPGDLVQIGPVTLVFLGHQDGLHSV